MLEENNNSNPPAEEAAETKADAVVPPNEVSVGDVATGDAPPAESENKAQPKEAAIETPTEPTLEAPETETAAAEAAAEPGPRTLPAHGAPASELSPPEKVSASTTSTPSQPDNIQNLLAKAKAKIAERRQKNLDKILETLQTKGKLSNQQLRQLTKKSNATVFRYMNILEKQGKARQVGKTGKYTYYELIK